MVPSGRPRSWPSPDIQAYALRADKCQEEIFSTFRLHTTFVHVGLRMSLSQLKCNVSRDARQQEIRVRNEEG